jgi:malate dehydrogenase
MSENRVIGSEHIEDARQRGRLVFEILPGDIVTSLAKETASRVGIELIDGPIEKPTIARTDGKTSMGRSLYRRSPKWIAPEKKISTRALRFSKISIVGAGGVGANISHLAANMDLSDEIAIIDIVPGLAAATALDLNHASGITRSSARILGGETLDLINGSEVVIVTAGRARTPGMTRSDLININKRVIQSTAETIKQQSPEAIVIVVTNPLDEMTMEMLTATGFPRERVLGMAGTLDSSRFRRSLAMAAGVKTADVEAITLGSHGDEMAPIISHAKIKGRSLERFLSSEEIAACSKDAITGGGQVVALKKMGSATIAPAHASIEILNHIRGAKSGSVPVSVMLDGEFGLNNVVLGVPAFLGFKGLVSVEEIKLSPIEMKALHDSAGAIRNRLGLK